MGLYPLSTVAVSTCPAAWLPPHLPFHRHPPLLPPWQGVFRALAFGEYYFPRLNRRKNVHMEQESRKSRVFKCPMQQPLPGDLPGCTSKATQACHKWPSDFWRANHPNESLWMLTICFNRQRVKMCLLSLPKSQKKMWQPINYFWIMLTLTIKTTRPFTSSEREKGYMPVRDCSQSGKSGASCCYYSRSYRWWVLNSKNCCIPCGHMLC